MISNLYAADCVYVSKLSATNLYPELSSQGECGEIIDNDTFIISTDHLNSLSFSDIGLATVYIEKRVFYVSRSGKAVRMHLFDNGADYFSEGLARTISNDQFGFINKDLEIVITPEYSFAFPFRNGIAVICNQCKTVSKGEHKDVMGGLWGAIDKTGKIVVPVKYTKDELYKNPKFNRISNRYN